MLDRSKHSGLHRILTLLLLSRACGASSLGLTVHVVPKNSDGGKTVQAHFMATVPTPCPSLSGLCAAGEECVLHNTSLPFNGTKPGSGWCVRQWQRTVPSNYNDTITLGSSKMYVSLNAAPKIRANSGRLNQPAFVALPPPLRARVNCPHHFHLSVKDLDGDRVRCRFALPDKNECVNCTQHTFIELDKEKCMFSFNGKATAGQYFIYLMAEDFIPVPKISEAIDNKGLSSVPVHLSLTVEESTSSCIEEPVATGETPQEDSTLFVLPYEEVKFSIHYESEVEGVLEAAVVGPPGLFRVGFKSIGSMATMKMAWVRAENTLARLLPICFAVNTNSLQSEPRCVWLYQRETRTLPTGTELKCDKTSMTLLLPISSLSNINLAELQLNSPTCPISYNSTHLTAKISLAGCGTKTVHSGSEMVYTNTLHSVRPYTRVSRKPSLILPLACRIPGVLAKGPQFKSIMPTEEEAFGEFTFQLEFYLPGEGPMARFTKSAVLRALRSQPSSAARLRREAGSSTEGNSTSTASTNITSTINTPTIGTSTFDSSTISTSTGFTIDSPISDSSTISTSTGFTSNSPTIGSSTINTSTISTSTTSSSLTTTMAVGSRLNVLDLVVRSNCSIDRAELMVSNCIESESEDFADSSPLLQQGCSASNSTLEVVTNNKTVKIYRLDLSTVEAQGSTMYVRCTVNLCITTLPSQQCPVLCTSKFNTRAMVDSVYTRSYTISSGPVSLVVTTPAPTTTAVAVTEGPKVTATTTTTAVTTTTAAQTTSTTAAHAPGQNSAMAAAVVLTIINIFLQNILLN